VHVNDATCIDDLQCSFGGWGASGIGRLGGSSGIESFTDVKWISVQDAPTSPYPYPY
jgi:benzaldehyde dehydrogenase (NAD)